MEPENGQGRPAESSFYFAYLVNTCQFAPRIVEKESDQSLILYLALNERRRNAEKCFLKLTELRRFPDCQFASQSYYAKMLDPDYYKVLLEIGVGRRFWQSNPLPRMLTPSTCEWSGRCDNSSVEVSWKNFRKLLPPTIELLSLWR